MRQSRNYMMPPPYPIYPNNPEMMSSPNMMPPMQGQKQPTIMPEQHQLQNLTKRVESLEKRVSDLERSINQVPPCFTDNNYQMI